MKKKKVDVTNEEKIASEKVDEVKEEKVVSEKVDEIKKEKVVSDKVDEVKEEKIVSEKVDNDKKTKVNKKFIIIGGIVLCILLVAISGLFIYRSYVNKPINLYKKAIAEAYEKFSEILEESPKRKQINLKEDAVVMDGTLKFNTNIPVEVYEFMNYEYNFSMGLDVKNKKMEFGASMSEGTKDILTAMVYVLDQTMYLDSKQLYDYALYDVMDEDIFAEFEMLESDLDAITEEELDTLVKKLLDYLSDALDEDNFKEEKATIEVNGKNVEVTKVIYPLNQDSVYEIAKEMLESIKKDDDLIGIIAKSLGEDKAQLQKKLNEKELSKKDFEMEDNLDFYLYTKGFFAEVIGCGFNDGASSLSLVVDGDATEVTMDGEGLWSVSRTEDEKTTGSLKIDGQEIATYTLFVEEEDDNAKIDLSIIMTAEGQKYELSFVSDVTEESDKKTKGSIETSITMYFEDFPVELGAAFDFTVELDADGIADFDSSNAVDLNTLTDEQFLQIATNLENALKDTFIYDLLYNFFTVDDEYLDYEYEYDYDYDLDIDDSYIAFDQ